MNWCCVGFESFYGNGGHQGAGLLMGRDSLGYPEFIIQYRATDIGQEVEFSSKDPIAPVIDVRLQYCPWCGRNLEKWYGNTVDTLDRPHLRIPRYRS